MSVDHDQAEPLSCRTTELTVVAFLEEIMERADVRLFSLYCRVFCNWPQHSFITLVTLALLCWQNKIQNELGVIQVFF